MAKKFRSEKDAEPKKHMTRKDHDGNYWWGSMRFTKGTLIILGFAGCFFTLVGLSVINPEFTFSIPSTKTNIMFFCGGP